MVPERGEIYWAELPAGRKPVLVVSRAVVSRLLTPIVVRVTATARNRAIPTFTELDPEDSGLPLPSVALAHEIVALEREQLDPAPVGQLPVGSMFEVEAALRYALDLA